MTRFTDSSAMFSPCRTYRYWLERSWGDGPRLGWLMLNPSTASEFVNDPTIRKCAEFARRNSYGGIIVANVYALRSTDPAGLWKVDDPSGPDNDIWHEELRNLASRIIAGWGTNARTAEVEHLLGIVPDLDCLGVNANGSPKHPLYLSYSTPFQPYARGGKLVAQEQDPCR